MKKVGCVLAYCNNYGTMLQSYATLKKIESLGYTCEMIRYTKNLTFIQKLQMFLRFLRVGEFSSHGRRLRTFFNQKRYPRYHRKKKVKDNAFLRFSDKKLKPYFKEYRGYEALKLGSKNYSLVLVGSDQIWSLMSLYGGFFNLRFVDDAIPKVSYASSFGVTSIPSFQQKATKAYLDRFDRIGVREQSGKEIVDSLSVNKAEVVADPSMLLTAGEWEDEISDIKIENHKPYIFCYFLGKNKNYREAVEELKKITGNEIVAICHNDEYVKIDEGFGDYVPYDVGPLEFLKYIHEAEYVCTDSFHCSVFSILFHRKFMSFFRYQIGSKGSRNTRIENLLSRFQLTDRIYGGSIKAILQDVDYETVDKIVRDYRECSLAFLKEELKLAK